MRKIVKVLFLLLFSVTVILSNTVFASADTEKVYLGGMPAGFSIEQNGAHVIGLCDVLTENGVETPSKDAGLKVGDIILSIDDVNTNSAKDVEKAVRDDKVKKLQVVRDSEKIQILLKPSKDFSGYYKIGVFIRDAVKGIGTITFIKGDRFASLGHPVLNDDGKLLEINGGELFGCSITGCKAGERGAPGELHGVFMGSAIGKIEKNLDCGVFGTIVDKNAFNLREIELGEGKPGDACIYSTINGDTPIEYSISIIKSDLDNKSNKNYIIKITDNNLLNSTGGIVQGMSGSPIIQNGKLIGAVTHVFVNDPTRGFGISISNMLNK